MFNGTCSCFYWALSVSRSKVVFQNIFSSLTSTATVTINFTEH